MQDTRYQAIDKLPLVEFLCKNSKKMAPETKKMVQSKLRTIVKLTNIKTLSLLGDQRIGHRLGSSELIGQFDCKRIITCFSPTKGFIEEF